MLRKLNGAVLFAYIVSMYLFTKNATMYKYANMLAFLFIFLVVFDVIVSKKRIVISYVIVCQALFIFVCSVSYFIAVDKDITVGVIKTLFNLLLLVWALVIHIEDYKQLYSVLNFIVYAGSISAVYILANPNVVENGRLGGILGDQNHIALLMSFSFLFAAYCIFSQKKYIYIPMGIILFYCILLTGSRVALIFIVFSILMTLMLKYRNSLENMLKYILILLITFTACYFLLFNVPQIYSVIGVRFQNLFDFVSGQGTNEGSIMTRLYYTKLGFWLFFQKPLLGYGAGNYSAMLNQIAGRETYSHNNYTELLVGTGLIGTITFYLAYLLSLAGLYKLVKGRNHLGFLFFSIIITIMVIGYSWVFYQMKAFYIFIALVAAFIKLDCAETEKE